MPDREPNAHARAAGARAGPGAGTHGEEPEGEIRFTAAGAALFRLLEAVDSLGRAVPEGVAHRGRLDLMRRLARGGPRTMSDLARERGASRQGVQRLARTLVREGLLELRANPRHRRAPLIALTARGRALYRELARAEARWLNGLARGLEAGELHAAARRLRCPPERPAS